jgi:acetyl-CoA carboxylase biotin carboxylase subunit
VFRKLLVANRGEIAARVFRACRELGIPSAAIVSEADRDALHPRLADEVHVCGPAPATQSYLAMERIVAIALEIGADAVHPGYGFLAENAAFAELCTKQGLRFVGPSADVIRAMGSKLGARRIMAAAGVPVVPGSDGPVSPADAPEVARRLGYPVMIKASAGGGGRGMRSVRDEAKLAEALERGRSESERSFGDGTLYLEKLLDGPRHVEVQVLADAHGQAVHCFERECSIQRRHQKLLEEAPARIDAELRRRLGDAALTAVRAVGYEGAGTVEFLLDSSGHFYFLEMNTRIQVEHPVTEMVTGIDLVREQIRIASGEGLGYKQDAVRFTGHAIECRVNAEDPEHFVPSSGRVTQWVPPGGPNVRVDSHLMSGYMVPPHYDSLIAKIIVHGRDRAEAIARMHRALSETVITGPKTTIPFHLKLLTDPVFLAGEFDQPRIEHSL